MFLQQILLSLNAGEVEIPPDTSVPSGDPFTVNLSFSGSSALIPFTAVYTFPQAVKFPYDDPFIISVNNRFHTLDITASSYDTSNNQYFNLITADDSLNYLFVGWDYNSGGVLKYASLFEDNLPSNVSLVDSGTMLQFEAGAQLFFRHVSAGGPQSGSLADIILTWTGEAV